MSKKSSGQGAKSKNGTVQQELQELATDIARLTEEIADIKDKFDKVLRELGQKKKHD
jgi:uncharacterized protein (UPF0335 family)